jgi:hypothetical protein
MGYWERTWQEREDEIRRRFGTSDPPGNVYPYSWPDIRLPGACSLVFPPVASRSSHSPWPHLRPEWLYLTLGLTQPLDEEQVKRARAAGKKYSHYGFELGFLTRERCEWPINALYGFLSHITEGAEIEWGDRFAFGLCRREDGSFYSYTGLAEELGLTPFGSIRAVLFWPYLLPDAHFVTQTGKAMIFIATGITQDEWELAKATSTPQLLLLLCRAGVGQRTDLNRSSILIDPHWRSEWGRIDAIGPEAAHAELDSGIGHW